MRNPTKMLSTALAAIMLISAVSVSTPASAWGRYGGAAGAAIWAMAAAGAVRLGVTAAVGAAAAGAAVVGVMVAPGWDWV